MSNDGHNPAPASAFAAPASAGQALALVSNASASQLIDELSRHGYRATSVDDPYAAMVELLDRPMVYRALVVSLPSLYREELAMIRAVRARLPHVDVLLAHTDGRHAALAEAMRLGATGLLSEEAIHRLAEVDPVATDDEVPARQSFTSPRQAADAEAERDPTDEAADPHDDEPPQEGRRRGTADPRPPRPMVMGDGDDEMIEPILTAEELRALLHEQPTMPPQP